MGLPTYSVGTASVANGNQSVSFAGGAALTSVDPTTGAALAVCGPGDVLVVAGSGGSFGVIQTVVDATHVTLETPWGGSTNAAAAYKIYRQSVPLTGSAAALAQTVLNQGSDSQPDLSRTIDNGVARTKVRIGSDGKAKFSAGSTGAADAALLDGLSIDPATGAASFPSGVKEYVLGFRNRIINGGFRVWQRGTSFTITAGTFVAVADRFFAYTGSTTAGAANKVAAPTGFRLPDAISLTRTGLAAGDALELTQRIESSTIADLDGVACTVSFDISATTSAASLSGTLVALGNSAPDNSTFSSVIFSVPFTVPVGASKVVVPLSAAQTAGFKNGIDLRIELFQNSSSGNVTAIFGAVQLEKGTIANDFEFRPLSVEMVLCKRYYQTFPVDIAGYSTSIGTGPYIVFPVEMRVAPTAANVAVTYNNSSNYSIDSISTRGCRVVAVATTTGVFYATSTSNTFNAEL